MGTPAWMTEGSAHVWRPYCQHQTAPDPLPVVSTHGSRLVLADGRELVDGIASWWTAAHGYRHPHITARVQAQLQTLPHVAFGGLAHEPAYSLATRLAGMLPAPLSRVFLVESGSVAVEVALKMAVQSFHNRGETRRRRVIGFRGGYHGDTFATMALSDPEDGMHRAFLGMGVDAVHLPVPTDDDGGALEAALERLAPDAACVIIEPLVQCAGGMRVHSVKTLQRLRAACTEWKLLLVFDEIATGFHRLGPRFAMEAAGVVPDIVTLGKALTGGTLPLAAAVASEAVFAAFLSADSGHALQHGPTYMGNALACAAAHASLDLFDAGDMGARVHTLEQALRAGLSRLRVRPHVREVRVVGGIGVVEMAAGTAPASAEFARAGAFIRPLRLKNADVVYLMPPLSIEPRDLAVLLDALDTTLPR